MYLNKKSNTNKFSMSLKEIAQQMWCLHSNFLIIDLTLSNLNNIAIFVCNWFPFNFACHLKIQIVFMFS